MSKNQKANAAAADGEKKKQRKNPVYNDYIVLAFSVLVAFGAWIGISFSDTTTESSRTIQDVQLDYANLPESVRELGLQVIASDTNVQEVHVEISGKQYIVNQVSPNDLKAYIRLTEATAAGTYTAEVRVEAIGRKDFTIDAINPQYVNVRLDRMTTKEYPLEYDTTKPYEAETGYTLKMPTLSNTTVTITGTSADMQQIARVVAVADVPSTINTTSMYAAAIKLYDEYGRELSNSAYTMSIEETELTIVAMRLKTVPIKLTYLNAPFKIGSEMISLSPSAVEVSVPSDLYDSLDELMVGSIDFSKVNTSNNKFTFDVNSILPAGCTNESDYDEVTATVSMAGMRTRELDVSNIVILSDAEDKLVEAHTKSVKLIITGPAEEAEQLESDDITVQVDLTNSQASLGTHEFPANVLINGGPRCWVFGSTTVFVQISEKPEEVLEEPKSESDASPFNIFG